MEIRGIKNSYNTTFSSKQLFNITLLKKTAKGAGKKVQAYISELNLSDIHRRDLSPKIWGKTSFGNDILMDFRAKYGLNPELAAFLKPEELRFFAVEIPLKNGSKHAIALGEVKIRDEFLVLDRLHSLFGGKENPKIKGCGNGILYSLVDMAKKNNKMLITLESSKEAVDFYKKSGMEYEPRNMFHFFRVYYSKYTEFLNNLKKKCNITPIK